MRCDQKILNRVKRAQGQIQGVLKMMEEQRDCDEIVTQLSAIRATLDKTIALITTQNLINTIEETHDIELTGLEKAVNLVVRSK